MKPTLRPSHRTAVSTLLDRKEGTFRRSDLVTVLYPLTSPRSRASAEGLADTLLKELVAAGQIQRHGHLHYIKVQRARALLDGSSAPERPETLTIPLTTKCPEKWFAVDAETGDVWVGSAQGWKRASDAQRKLAVLAAGPRQ